jgi:hypothetical protein
MLIKITSPFLFAHRGVDVVDYPAGLQDVLDEVADVALAAGWAVPAEPVPNPAPAAEPARTTRRKPK